MAGRDRNWRPLRSESECYEACGSLADHRAIEAPQYCVDSNRLRQDPDPALPKERDRQWLC